MKRVETTTFESHVSYFDKYGTIKTFYYYIPSSVFKGVDEPMVLKGTDGETLLFLVPCKFFTPGLTTICAEALKELQGKTGLPTHLGFFDAIDYATYFEDDTSESRLIKANTIVTQWVTKNIPCGKPRNGKQRDAMPLELRRRFKQMANNGRFDIVPEDTMAYLPQDNGRTMEIPGWINPQEDKDDSQWSYPASDLYQQLKDQGWRLRFPKASTHTVLKWADNFSKLIAGNEEAGNATRATMKKTTNAAVTLQKRSQRKCCCC